MDGRDSQLDHIVARFGGQNAMARALGCAQSTVWEWVQSGRIPSDRRILEIIRAARKLEPPLHLTPNDLIPREKYEDDRPSEAA